MKKQLLIFVLLSVSCFCYAQKEKTIKSKKLKNDTITWSTDSLLSVDDFMAKPKKNSAGSACCLLYIGAKDDGGQLLFFVKAVFLKSKSYIVPNSDYILKHEQVLYNICELYARKLRQMIKAKDFTRVHNVQGEIQQMYTKVNGDMVREENKYETDTQGGLNSAKQQLWADNIQKQLNAMEKFSSTDINIVHK